MLITNNPLVPELTYPDYAGEFLSLFLVSEPILLLCPKERTRVRTKYNQNPKVNQSKQQPEQWYNKLLNEKVKT